MVRNLGITLPGELVKDIDDCRDSTVSRSEWLAEAAEARLDAEETGDWPYTKCAVKPVDD